MRIARTSLMFLYAALWAGHLSCGLVSKDVLDTKFALKKQVYNQDFGQAMGQVPSVPCSAQMNSCQQLQGQLPGSAPGVTQAQAKCDMMSMTCYAQADVTLTEDIHLGDYSVLQGGVNAVKSISIDYSLPPNTNTLTFAIPPIEIYVGPPGTTSKSQPDVVLIGKTAPIPKMTSVSDTITVMEGTQAFDALAGYIKQKNASFVFLIAASPQMKAGDPLPAGKVELDLVPRFTLGIP